MSSQLLIVVIDGCALAYVNPQDTPYLFRLAEQGFFKVVHSAIPSVTNVNHATILSGAFPEQHEVVGNYFYDRGTGEHGFIEDPHHMKMATIIDRYQQAGRKTALLTVKGKVLEVFGKNATIGVNLQKTTPEQLASYDLPAPPDVNTLDTYDWIFQACYRVIEKEKPDLVYCTTNDYMMHNYRPEAPEAKRVMATIDRWLGKIYDLDPTREIYITADHGMNQKTHLVDMQRKLDQAGFHTYCLLPMKDRYLANHRYQEGGTLFLYLLDESQREDLLAYLAACDFIEEINTKEEAIAKYHLPGHKDIGDFLLLAKPEAAFAELSDVELITDQSRTHGSLYEREIPLFAVNARRPQEEYAYSKNIVEYILADENLPE